MFYVLHLHYKATVLLCFDLLTLKRALYWKQQWIHENMKYVKTTDVDMMKDCFFDVKNKMQSYKKNN